MASRKESFDEGQFTKLDVAPFKGAFTVPGQKAMTTEPDFQQLTRGELSHHHLLQQSAERVAGAFEAAHRKGLVERGMRYYDDENARLAEIGSAFNDRRRATGRQTYFEDDPHLAGALLSGAYSANNTEVGRNRLIRNSMATGDVGAHLSTGKIEAAIRGDSEGRQAHPLDVLGDLKLRDYTGSQLHPDTWDGTHNGRRLGLGYTIDRHQHDIVMGRQFGDHDRGISGGATGARRYRIMQAGHAIAHDWVDPSRLLSPARFQAITWGGHRGGFD